MKIIFEGLIPSKKNEHRIHKIPMKGSTKFNPKYRRSIGSSKKYEKWEKTNIKWLKLHAPKKPIENASLVYVELYFGTKHRADCTNKAESIMDAIVGGKILEDDDWANTGPVLLIPRYRKGKPGAKVVIVESKKWWYAKLLRLFILIKSI